MNAFGKTVPKISGDARAKASEGLEAESVKGVSANLAATDLHVAAKALESSINSVLPKSVLCFDRLSMNGKGQQFQALPFALSPVLSLSKGCRRVDG